MRYESFQKIKVQTLGVLATEKYINKTLFPEIVKSIKTARTQFEDNYTAKPQTEGKKE